MRDMVEEPDMSKIPKSRQKIMEFPELNFKLEDFCR